MAVRTLGADIFDIPIPDISYTAGDVAKMLPAPDPHWGTQVAAALPGPPSAIGDWLAANKLVVLIAAGVFGVFVLLALGKGRR